MLTTYQSQLQALIQAPTAPAPLIPTATQTAYINQARNQLAADAECIRDYGTIATVANQDFYGFDVIALPAGAGLQTPIAVRSALIGTQNLEVRGWEWYAAYYLGRAATTGTPTLMAQLGQSTSGTLVFWPKPSSVLTVRLDCVILPIALVDDTTIEAIPILWRDAVPFYAAFLAMQSLQRQADAEAMLRRYMLLARRGRQLSTPSELPENLPGGTGAEIAAAHTILGQPATPTGGR